jgi:hypothetical protein
MVRQAEQYVSHGRRAAKRAVAVWPAEYQADGGRSITAAIPVGENRLDVPF